MVYEFLVFTGLEKFFFSVFQASMIFPEAGNHVTCFTVAWLITLSVSRDLVD